MKHCTRYDKPATCIRCAAKRKPIHQNGVCILNGVTKLRHKWNDANHERPKSTLTKDEKLFKGLFKNTRQRCELKSCKDYKNYGERGIKFLWYSYEEFRRDMYDGYIKHRLENGSFNTTIERIDPNGNYSKENCTWVTWKEQSRNKRDSRFITYNGRTMNAADWAYEIGASRAAISYRIKAGWQPEKIIEIPFNQGNGHKHYGII